MRLQNKVVIITGAAKGIGEAIVRSFIKEGSKVFLCDRLSQTLELTSTRLKKMNPSAQIEYQTCDITSPKQIESVVTNCTKTLGDPNVLINNAGVNFFNAPLQTKCSDWSACIDNDLTGAWNFAKATLIPMVKNKDGSIVNIASVHAHKIIPGCFPYPVAKHGIIGLTKALGVEYAKENVRVNSISPGLIETPSALRWYEQAVKDGLAEDVESFRKKQAEILPCKRIGTPEEVAMTAVFLASDEARFINATDILMDGGRSALYHE